MQFNLQPVIEKQSIEQTLSRLARTITPILGITSDRLREHVVSGTGVFLRIQDKLFVLTAGHIIRDLAAHPQANAFLCGNMDASQHRGQLVPARGMRSSSLDPKVDLGYFELNQTTLDALGNIPALSLDDTIPLEMPMAGCKCIALGCPDSRTNYRWSASLMDMEWHGFLTYAIEPTGWAPYDPELHIALHYDREDAFRIKDQRKVVTPELNGQSGGAIWVLPQYGEHGGKPLYASPRLVGIATQWDPKERRMLATRIACVLGMIRENYPGLATSIDKAYANTADPPMKISPEPPPRPMTTLIGTIGRNDFCPCGSKRKYKKCHGA